MRFHGLLALTLGLSLLAHAGMYELAHTYGNGPETSFRQGPIEVEVLGLPDAPPRSASAPRKTVFVPRIEEEEETEMEDETGPAAPPSVPASGPSVAANGSLEGSPDGTDSPVYGEEAVDTPARLLTEPNLRYPRSALQQGVEGDVTLTLVVTPEGKVVEAKIGRSPGMGFDQAALEAAKDFRFRPALKQGRPVTVRLKWTVRFRLG